MPHESERLRGDAALHDIENARLCGTDVEYQGRHWLVAESIEEGRALRLIDPSGEEQRIVVASEVRCQ